MATLISSYTTPNTWLVIEENGQIAANTPGGIDLDNLVLGTSYFRIDKFASLVHEAITASRDKFRGWTFSPDVTTVLKTKGYTGGNVYKTYTIMGILDSTQQGNFEDFFEYHQANAASQLYLVRQWAATTFKHFSYNSTQYNYAAVCPIRYRLVETNRGGKYNQELELLLVHAYREKTS